MLVSMYVDSNTKIDFGFSIVIPVYKNYHMLSRCLNSINTQKIPVEIIIVDDTPNEEREIIKKNTFNIRHPIHVLINSRNCGVTYSRNKGYSFARYSHVVFLDSDDSLVNDAFDKMIDVVISVNSSIYLFRTIDINGKLIGTPKERKKYSGIDGLIDTYGIGECLVVVQNIKNKKPFISIYRGHELAGLLRFYVKLTVKKGVFLSEYATRTYMQDNAYSISSGSGLLNRLKLMSDGHMYVAMILINFESAYFASIPWLARCFFRRFQFYVHQLKNFL
jgi:glycosyltransferase involved in cell wall biosynthesis